jgi:LPXTG-motif cell wall-anchored protein
MSTSSPSTTSQVRTATGGRRGLAVAVGLCIAGSAIALLAATRTWTETLTRRPAPLPPAHTPHTGTSQLGWLVAIALVALAGAGALLATRNGVRVGLGALLGLVGVAILGGGIDGLRIADGGRLVWPVLVMVGGVLVAMAGMRAMRHGASWPAMGAKYERPAGAVKADKPVTDATMWDDLDRGVDPTAGD